MIDETLLIEIWKQNNWMNILKQMKISSENEDQELQSDWETD